MSLRVYNTLARKKELFESVEPGKVGIYLCGPTVYKPSHIGHAVGPVIFDAVKRYLTHKGYEVTWVINITDVDDKLIAEAARQHRPVEQLACELEANYLECMEALGVRNVDHFPRATEHIDDIIALVQRLIDRGAAYVVDGDVYFDHTRAAGYGKLSGRSVEEGLAGTREIASRSRHPADFAVWKASGEGEPGWDSPWGRGRPGWHIECSAMGMSLLGETFDIHGGGMDLIFPHHENEIAQSETATGKPFVKYWMHNGLTRVNTKKMSKSEDNFRTISDLLAQHAPETIRGFILSTHYRRPLDFSDEQLASTARALGAFHRLFDRIRRDTGTDVYAGGDTLERLHDHARDDTDNAFVQQVLAERLKFYEAMDDDFNTAGAMASLHAIAAATNRYMDTTGLDSGGEEAPRTLAAAAGATLVTTGRILGLFEQPPATGDLGDVDAAEVERLVAERDAARRDKDYARADAIRDRLQEMGIVLEDTPGGTVWRKA